MIGLVQTMAVYVERADGIFAELAGEDIPCRLARLSRSNQMGPYRDMLGTEKNLIWESFVLPEHCEIEIEGERWTPQLGTRNNWHGPNGQLHHHSVTVVRGEAS